MGSLTLSYMDSADTWHSIFSVTGNQAGSGTWDWAFLGQFLEVPVGLQIRQFQWWILAAKCRISGRRLASWSSCPAPQRHCPAAKGSYRPRPWGSAESPEVSSSGVLFCFQWFLHVQFAKS